MAKKESYVNKGNRQIQEEQTPLAMQTIMKGLNDYQNKIIKSLNPYPSSDAALVVVVLRTLANVVEDENPSCKVLVNYLTKQLESPVFVQTEKYHSTKARK